MMIKEIYVGGGCFWGVEKFLSLIKGVVETNVGYANGMTKSPSYQDVCYRNTGHVESVKIRYDSKVVSLEHLLSMFYKIIDPTSINRQGNDRGTQYRTGIYYTDPSDIPIIQASLEKLQKKFDKPIAIEVEELDNYYEAEDYHQKYLDNNPQGYCHIPPNKFEEAAQTKPKA